MQSAKTTSRRMRPYVQRLAAEGLAVHEPARGAIIAELNKNEILDLYAMREVLEGTAAFTAAQRATAEDIAELWRIIEKEKRHLPERVNLAAINKEFHHALTGRRTTSISAAWRIP